MKKKYKIILSNLLILTTIIIGLFIIFLPRKLLKEKEEFSANIIYLENGTEHQAIELTSQDTEKLEQILRNYTYYLYPNLKIFIFEDHSLWNEDQSQYYISWIGNQKDYMTKEWELQILDNTAYLMSYRYYYKIYKNDAFVKEIDNLLSKYRIEL